MITAIFSGSMKSQVTVSIPKPLSYQIKETHLERSLAQTTFMMHYLRAAIQSISLKGPGYEHRYFRVL